MAFQVRQIPIDTTPNQTFGTELNGKRITFQFRWFARTEGWYMSVYENPSGEPITLGQRLREGINYAKYVPQLDGSLRAECPDFPDYRRDSDIRLFYFFDDGT